MKILLSPAKIMSLETTSHWNRHTQPEYIDFSKKLHSVLKEYSPSELESLLDISPKLSKENWERIQEWKANPSKKESVQSVFAFKGEVYRGLDAETLSSASLNYLQKNLLIISGLYGLLRPSDDVMLYRMEMGKKLKIDNSKDLYGFWGDTLTHYFNSSLKKDEPILNLSSKEYFKVFKAKNLTGKIIDVEFKDYKDGKLKSITIYFKNARGKMTRWCAENNIKKIDDIKTYNENGYEFSEKLSKENNLVFIR
jgi:cytoplasmic iron level regulating protein YaaA (DUF328/UPF0246 family)